MPPLIDCHTLWRFDCERGASSQFGHMATLNSDFFGWQQLIGCLGYQEWPPLLYSLLKFKAKWGAQRKNWKDICF